MATFGTLTNPAHYVEIADPLDPGQVKRPAAGQTILARTFPGEVALADITTTDYGYWSASFASDAITVSGDGGTTWVGPLVSAEGTVASATAGADAAEALAMAEQALAAAQAAGTSNIVIGTTAGTAAAGDDPRLSDARTPLSHTHTVAGIDSGIAGDGDVMVSDGAGGAAWTSLDAVVAAKVAALPPIPVKFSAAVATVGASGSDRAFVARSIKEVHMRAQSAPVGSDLVVAVQSFAAGAWTTVATATIAAGSTTAYANTALNVAQIVGNLLRVNPSSVGSTTPAANVVVDVVFG